ncbi:hypothetical protein F1654_03030 [Alkalicaulis satelles]|uniref:Cellulose biosynthesis protein BcsS n=1 Tax=Alkalicaulis satelles TaxID=2609175 RepID=A0A5M6ZN25_9PROT|nr:hypothetical protein [Alkalicaulis satelles]KAA5804984.1 hypothetical protein F1654_03030 [Alkalicaulis satelles]
MARWAGVMAGLAGLASAGAAAPAEASAWTRARGETLLISTQTWQRLDGGPGGVVQSKTEGAVYAEYGWRDHITLVGRAAVQSIDRSYLEPWQGIGGVEGGVRLRLYRQGPWAASTQFSASVRTPGENRFNAALGEGGGDLELRVLGGRSIGRSTFIDAQAAWRRRPGGTADELRFDLTAGTHIWRGLRVMGQSFSVWSTGGPAHQRAYACHRMQVSAIWPLSSRTRMQIGVLGTVSRQNTGMERSAFLSLWRRF